MGIRRRLYGIGRNDGVSYGSPDPRLGGQHFTHAEWGKYYRRGYTSGAQLHIAHSEARGYCTRCGQRTENKNRFCGQCGAQVKLAHRRPWSLHRFFCNRPFRQRGEL